MKKVSVVIPAMNEEKNISRLLDDIISVERSLKDFSFENIIVDDHSDDKTAEIAESRGCSVIHNEGFRGKGSSLRLGFSMAEGDYIVMLDADYSHRAEDIPLFIEQLDNGAGLVIGSRIFGGSDEYTRVRAFGNIFLTWFFGFLFGRYLSDALNGFKAFKRDLVDKFQYKSNNFEIEIELIANALRLGQPVVEVPSHERGRTAGKAKSKVIKDGFRFFFRIIIEKFTIKSL